ncbi:MAG: tryptophan synthase subunit alpha [Candidatus Caldarchaeum sp.]
MEETFASLRHRDERALVVFITGGDPDVSELPSILRVLEDAGADVIEVGIPFSDPIADGPTIQASSQRALERGIRLDDIFEAVFRAGTRVPIVYMGYMNVVMRRGLREFAQRARASGAAGVLLSDLPPESADEWKEAARETGLDTIFLVAPTTPDERVLFIAGYASGFLYCVSRMGVTGAENEVPSDVKNLVKRVKQRTSLPVCVGFGISRPEQVAMVCEMADGAVVGSYLVELLHQHWGSGKGAEVVRSAVMRLKAATR